MKTFLISSVALFGSASASTLTDNVKLARSLNDAKPSVKEGDACSTETTGMENLCAGNNLAWCLEGKVSFVQNCGAPCNYLPFINKSGATLACLPDSSANTFINNALKTDARIRRVSKEETEEDLEGQDEVAEKKEAEAQDVAGGEDVEEQPQAIQEDECEYETDDETDDESQDAIVGGTFGTGAPAPANDEAKDVNNSEDAAQTAAVVNEGENLNQDIGEVDNVEAPDGKDVEESDEDENEQAEDDLDDIIDQVFNEEAAAREDDAEKSTNTLNQTDNDEEGIAPEPIDDSERIDVQALLDEILERETAEEQSEEDADEQVEEDTPEDAGEKRETGPLTPVNDEARGVAQTTFGVNEGENVNQDIGEVDNEEAANGKDVKEDVEDDAEKSTNTLNQTDNDEEDIAAEPIDDSERIDVQALLDEILEREAAEEQSEEDADERVQEDTADGQTFDVQEGIDPR